MTTTSRESTEEPREQLDRALGFARRALRHYKAILVTFVLGLIAAGIVLRWKPPTYRSEAVIVYTESMRIGETGDPGTQPRSTTMRVQEILTSRQVLQRVVEEFDLYAQMRREHGPVEAVDEMKKHVELKAPGGDTFTIGFEGATPTEAQQVTKRLGELVIEEDTGIRKKQAESSRDFLASEKKRTEKSLKDAEQELASFMAEHPRFALDATPLQTGAAIRATTATIEPRPAPGAGGGPPPQRLIPLPGSDKSGAPAAAQPTVDPEMARLDTAERQRAEAAVAAARSDLADKRARFTDAHPDVRAAADAVARAEARLAPRQPKAAAPAPVPAAGDAPGEAKTAEKADERPARRYIPSAPARPSEAAPKTKNSDIVTLETDWVRLTRAVIEARQKHDQVEAALFKADMTASSTNDKDGAGAQMTIIDPAFRPERPVPPGPKTIAAGSAGLSLVLGILIALGFAIVDDRIYDRRGAAGLAYVLVEVPRHRSRRRARG